MKTESKYVLKTVSEVKKKRVKLFEGYTGNFRAE